MVYIRDVGNVRDGYAVQQNIVSQNGVRSGLLQVLKSANASTLSIVDAVKTVLPKIQATLPPSLKLTQLFDHDLRARGHQRSFAGGHHRGGVDGADDPALSRQLAQHAGGVDLDTALDLCSIIIMGALGQTLNIMTLGGLALAVGILVDDATVEVENIHRNLAMGKPMIRAILDGASQIAVPAFVSTLCICIVFVPIFFLSGVAKFLFMPLAMGYFRDAGVLFPVAHRGADDGEISPAGTP